ncbi:MAG: D-2-hydroxyacid dehydrogenase [Clostridia bacterium]|nr:D-2-hydroxyacid dehydrogenase [Clostridia bacterium]
MGTILILEPFKERHLERIRSAALGGPEVVAVNPNSPEVSEEIVLNELQRADMVVGEPSIELLMKCPNIKFVQMTWAGTDIYTRREIPFPSGIMLSNGSGTYGYTMSQFVIGMILSLMLHFKTYHDNQNNRIWKRSGVIKSLDNANVLIYGAGDIGTAIAERLTGFNAHVTGVCRDTSKERKFFDQLVTLEESEAYINEADVVIGCIPNSAETTDFFNARRLNLMKKDSILINVGRGNFVDCLALNDVLNSGHLWGAGLDVTNPEPLPEDHPLWSNPRCMITPHASGGTFGFLDETENRICEIVCDNIRRFIGNQEIRNRIY